MKILFISALSRHSWGGSEALWYGAALSLRESGVTIGVCVQARRQEPEEIQRLRLDGVSLCLHHPFGFFGDTFRGYRQRLFQRWPRHDHVRRWLLSQKPDLVCLSGGNFKDGLWAMQILCELNIPYVIIVQANVEWLWPSDPERLRLVEAYQKARAVYFVSLGNLELLQDQLAVQLNNAEVVRNPFNVDWHQPDCWPEQNDVLNFACVGRLEPDAKGQDLILKSLAHPEWRDRNVRISFYGNGRSEQGLKELTSKYNLQDKVRFMGHTYSIVDIWSNHHALLLPSRYEGLPLALVEAMLCGRPALVTDVAGNCELVNDGIEGFVVDSANYKQWSAGMERLWVNRYDLKRMGIAARQKACAEIPLDPCAVFAKKLLSVIKNGESLLN